MRAVLHAELPKGCDHCHKMVEWVGRWDCGMHWAIDWASSPHSPNP
jgi:hypothetical protein